MDRIYKEGDRIVITDESVLRIYDMKDHKGVILKGVSKGSLENFYYKVICNSTGIDGNIINFEILIGVPEFEYDIQYYREERFKKLLDE